MATTIKNVLQSGTITGEIEVSGNGGKFYIDWKEGDMSIANNTTKVWARMRFVQGSIRGDSVSSSCPASLKINGTKVFSKEGRAYFMTAGGTFTSWKDGDAWEGELVVEHGTDGKKSITISGTIDTGTVSTYLPRRMYSFKNNHINSNSKSFKYNSNECRYRKCIYN